MAHLGGPSILPLAVAGLLRAMLAPEASSTRISAMAAMKSFWRGVSLSMVRRR